MRRILSTRPSSLQHQSREGAAATELALLLPILITMGLGVADYGRIFSTASALANAVRIGAEQGATHRLTVRGQEAWEARVRNAVVEELQNLPRFSLNKLTLHFERIDRGNDRFCISVVASYPFQTIVDWPALPHHVLLQRTACVEEHR